MEITIDITNILADLEKEATEKKAKENKDN